MCFGLVRAVRQILLNSIYKYIFFDVPFPKQILFQFLETDDSYYGQGQVNKAAVATLWIRFSLQHQLQFG